MELSPVTLTTLLAALVASSSAFILSLGTQAPAVVTGGPPVPSVCADKISNCRDYGQSSCSGQYERWAKDNCRATCGFCVAPPTAPPPCQDALPDCANYDSAMCSDDRYRGWAEANCRRHCGFCTASQLQAIAAAPVTTIAPSACVDQADCARYGKDACDVTQYGTWGRDNCPQYCGVCQGPPTTPPPCIDVDPSCNQYQADLCTATAYTSFVQKNCRKFCNKC